MRLGCWQGSQNRMRLEASLRLSAGAVWVSGVSLHGGMLAEAVGQLSLQHLLLCRAKILPDQLPVLCMQAHAWIAEHLGE